VNLTANTVYYYRVRAYNAYGSSAFSNTASTRTAAYSTVPTTVTRADAEPVKSSHPTVFSTQPIKVV
jgi:hypothetical protein